MLALGGNGGFVARTADTLQDHLPEILLRAHAFKGAAFVEVLQNCIVYNDNAFGDLTSKRNRSENTVIVRHGEPMLFGADNDKGLVYEPVRGEFRVTENAAEASAHDETNWALAAALARADDPALPTPLGVFYCAPREDFLSAREARVPYAPLSRDDLKDLLYADSWSA